MSRLAAIRVDGHPMRELAEGACTYVSHVGMSRDGAPRHFELTRVKAAARTFTLATASRVIRELGPTQYQLSVCDAVGAW